MTEREDIEGRDDVYGPTRRIFLGAAVAAGVLAGAAAPAQAASTAGRTAKGAESGRATATAASLPSCPSGMVCAFSADGTQVNFPTSGNSSNWIDFDSVVGFHPTSIINNSGSDIWLYDAAAGSSGGTTGGPYPAFGTSLRQYTFTTWVPVNGGTSSQGYTAQTYQPGWFFINFGVNTCVGPAPTPLPT